MFAEKLWDFFLRSSEPIKIFQCDFYAAYKLTLYFSLIYYACFKHFFHTRLGWKMYLKIKSSKKRQCKPNLCRRRREWRWKSSHKFPVFFFLHPFKSSANENINNLVRGSKTWQILQIHKCGLSDKFSVASFAFVHKTSLNVWNLLFYLFFYVSRGNKED